MYESDFWAIKKGQGQRMQVDEMRMLRYMSAEWFSSGELVLGKSASGGSLENGRY